MISLAIPFNARHLLACCGCAWHGRAGDEVYPAQKDRSSPVTQCHVWMANISPSVLMIVDLEGGTLLDWWNTHIGKVGGGGLAREVCVRVCVCVVRIVSNRDSGPRHASRLS